MRQGRVTLITGGSRCIGAAIVHALAGAGFRVAGNAWGNEVKGRQLLARIGGTREGFQAGARNRCNRLSGLRRRRPGGEQPRWGGCPRIAAAWWLFRAATRRAGSLGTSSGERRCTSPKVWLEAGITYNFDPDRWAEGQRELVRRRWMSGELDEAACQAALRDIDRRCEEMWVRLGGSYQLPPQPRGAG